MTVFYTQLIFVIAGQEHIFDQFENQVLPLLGRHLGRLLYRIRPSAEAFLLSEGPRPYEVHLVEFPSAEAFRSYANDPERLAHIALRDSSVERVILLEGRLL
jgi:uncharacterized protein (DUF1330 family)